MRVDENAYFAGTLEAKTLVPSDGCVTDASLSASAKLSHLKLEHQHRFTHAQDVQATVWNEELVIHNVYGDTGVVLFFEAGIVIPATGAITATADLKNNGVSILTAPLELDSADVAYTAIAGNVASPNLVDGDVLSVEIISLGADSPDWEYDEEFLGDAGDTLPGQWGINAQTANSTEDYVTDTASGNYSLINSADDEAQSTQLFGDDNLWIDLFERPIIEFRAKLDLTGTNALGSADQRLVIGVSSAHTNAEDSLDAVTVNAWFRMEGTSANILVEADDGTLNTDDQDSTIDLVDNIWTHFKIDFSDLTDVKFEVDGVEQGGAAVSMANIAATVMVQPIVCLQRDTGTEEEKIYIDRFRVRSGSSLGTQAKGIFTHLGLREDAQ